MKLAPTSEAAAVLCAITVTSVATMWEEKEEEEEETERGVKSSACPSLLHSGCCCQIYGTKSKHTWMRLSCSLCEHLELLLPTARGRAAVWFVVCVCVYTRVWPGLFWVVDQAWPLFCRWRHSVWEFCALHPPINLSLNLTLPFPPSQVCRLNSRAAPKSAKASPATHTQTQLEAQSQGDFKTAGRN